MKTEDIEYRGYSADEVREFVKLLRGLRDLPAAELAGMEKLADLLKHYESTTDADIEAEVRRYYPSV
jgi:hypothetical protein